MQHLVYCSLPNKRFYLTINQHFLGCFTRFYPASHLCLQPHFRAILCQHSCHSWYSWFLFSAVRCHDLGVVSPSIFVLVFIFVSKFPFFKICLSAPSPQRAGRSSREAPQKLTSPLALQKFPIFKIFPQSLHFSSPPAGRATQSLFQVDFSQKSN